MTTTTIDDRQVNELEQKFDPEMRFRPTWPPASTLLAALLIALSCFHYYTAGFGLLREATHRGVHLAFVLGLIFIVFGFRRTHGEAAVRSAWAPGGVPLVDWLLAVAVAVAVLYVPYVFDDLAFRVGNPTRLDVAMGSILLVLLLEATRRSMGWPLPLIAMAFMFYALAGPIFPGLLQHAGASWSQLVNHQYLTSQGIYGIAVGVVATYVFHFVLFGVLATRVGLGQLFLDVASAIAGRYAGGPAKVSVFGSAMFGMLSGSSVANAVTVGSLTIPAMIRVGYRREFAGAVEAAASTGGQITPPVLGAAAFLMIEFLALPYQTIIAAAVVPAFMHFFGVFMQVHFEAKRFGLRGLTADEMPRLRESLRLRWPTLIPLVLLIGILVSGRTPYLAAFSGITSCAIVGLTTGAGGEGVRHWSLLVALHAVLLVLAFGGIENEVVRVGLFAAAVVATPLLLKALDIKGRIGLRTLVEAFETGAKYALAVGAAAATVGIVIGVVTLTGVGFKLSTIITGAAQGVAGGMLSFLPGGLFDLKALTLLVALAMTGLVCILLGCGIPTTANYIIMVAVAAPTLVVLGVEPLVAHFFVFYYGVLADITPPVALAAYAAAGMAGSDPFKTGNMAFRLGMAKALVPFVFVFSPSLLLVAKGFNLTDFAITFVGCVVGVTLLAAALSKYLLSELQRWEQLLLACAALLLVAPGLPSGLTGLAIASPVFARQWLGRARAARAVA
ncbi:MAG: TRAP transporter permease [Ideonella sp.]|nr:TRAP transporter permease [Ideonella sp.]